MIYNKLLENIILPAGDKVIGANFMKHLRNYRNLSQRPLEELYQIQRDKLEKLLDYSTAHSPYYKTFRKDRKEDPYEWLQEFPILKKNTLRYDTESILTTSSTDGLEKLSSSGSTGLPSIVYIDQDELSLSRAIQVLWWEWSGYKLGNSLIQTGFGTDREPVKAVKDFLLNTTYMYAFYREESKILEELKNIRKNPKDHFFGYASSIHLFAKTAKKHDIRDIKFKSIVSWAESMPDEFKKEIEEVFNTKVYDTYGASEGLLVSAQCINGSYHLTTPHIVVEYLDDQGKEVKTGELGRVVVTCLTNLTTPLIRYEIGDMAYKDYKESCGCGISWPAMGKLVGRTNEVLTTPAGQFITVPNVVLIMRDLEEVEEYKLIQKDNFKFEVQIKSDQKLDNDYYQRVKDTYLHYLGEKMDIEVKQLDSIERSPSGKIQLVKDARK